MKRKEPEDHDMDEITEIGISGMNEKKEESITGIDGNVSDCQKSDLYSDFPLPVGIEMRNVRGIDVPAQLVGNALQFLEFCAVFGEILEVKKEQAELVLRDLLHSKPGGSGELSLTARFHIHLLSILQEEGGEEDSRESPSHQDEAWLITLKECLSLSPSVLTQNGLDCLETTDDYEALNASQKLLLLNILCDELLETEKLRIWMNDQNIIHAEKLREAKKEVAAAKDEVLESKGIVLKSKSLIRPCYRSMRWSNIGCCKNRALLHGGSWACFLEVKLFRQIQRSSSRYWTRG